jgi:prepilin peptidase CpaA
MSWDPLFAVTATLLAVAAASDVSRHRIPNALPVAIAACSLAARAIEGGPGGGLSALAALGLTGAVLFPAWARGAIGGGDLKLAAAAAAWVGLTGLPAYALASAGAAGLLAVLCYLASAPAARREIRTNLLLAGRRMPVSVATHPAQGRAPLPAGAAFAAGAFLTNAARMVTW